MIRIMKASAGSGKTYNLAKTYISLLLKNEDRYAYRHILAVTFTNKATEEMKSRILKELHILATSPATSDYHDAFVPAILPDDAALSARAAAVLRDILHDYSAFAVSTIDKFFQQTLKAFSREIGQFASYQVELDKDSLVAESVDRVLDSLTQDDTGLLSWLTDNVLEQIEQGGRYSPDANLLGMALRLKSVQRQDEVEKAGINEQVAYSQQTLSQIRDTCRGIIADFRTKVRQTALEAVEVLKEKQVDPKESYRGFMCAILKYASLADNDYLAFPTAAFMERAPRSDKWFAASKATTLLPKLCPDLEVVLKQFCSLWEKEYPVYMTACILDDQIYGLGVARELSDAFNDIMKEKNVLCIDDSNTILKGIIDGSDAPFIYEKIGVRFDHFLLDEFQDTSSVQWSNFSSLLHNSHAQGNENLIVGDVKQSIYRWRGSDWKLLDSAVPAEFPGFTEEVLDTNYRSLSNIVEFNNAYFKQAAAILDKMNGEDRYMSGIYADVKQEVAKKDKAPGSVSVTFCPKADELQKVLDAVMEARAAGARLSEIAVLVRSNMTGQNVASYLIDNGITVITDDSLKVKRSVAVRRLVSLMSLVENPEDTVNGYLAESLNVAVPKAYTSLVDMAEALIRELQEVDTEDVMNGEILHLQSFMDHLHEYVASNGNSLRGFLKHWEGIDPSISSPASGESVRVMTIHKSKGLDFPYVIIPFAENIGLFKPDSRWCAPDLRDTPLEGVAEGVYDVTLSRSSESTLFAEHYRKENQLQQVDNINTIYVAMTRAALGMHIIAATPSAGCLANLKDHEKEGWKPSFTDFSQILYWFLAVSGKMKGVCRSEGDGYVRFNVGELVDFAAMRKSDASDTDVFPTGDDKYPSYSLNPGLRLKLSADALDFFAEDGTAGVEASNRIRGVVLHDIMADIRVPSDVGGAVDAACASGNLTSAQADHVKELLSRRVAEAQGLGWFPADPSKVMVENDIIDVDGQVYRPDRVVIEDGKVLVIDYKFGQHHNKYERQMRIYSEIFRRMGYADVTAVLWYLQTGEYKVI